MAIYLINIFITSLLGIHVHNSTSEEERNHRNKVLCMVCSICWIIISGFRDLSVGPDTIAYKVIFDNIKTTNFATLWQNLFSKFGSISNLLEGNINNKDPGYYLLTKVLQYIFPTYRLYLIFVAVLFMALLGRFLYKNTRSPYLGFIMFDCLFYSFYAITGIRQTLATALIVLLGYEFIKERKLVLFAIVSITAFFIHKSAICFVMFYFLCNIKVNKRIIAIWVVLIGLAFSFKSTLMTFLGPFVGYDQYARQYEGSSPTTFTLLILGLLLLCAFYHERMLEYDEGFRFKFNALCLTAGFLPLAYIDPSAMRISYYYALFVMLLLDDISVIFNERSEFLVKVLLSAMMIALLILNKPQYSFFFFS